MWCVFISLSVLLLCLLEGDTYLRVVFIPPDRAGDASATVTMGSSRATRLLNKSFLGLEAEEDKLGENKAIFEKC